MKRSNMLQITTPYKTYWNLWNIVKIRKGKHPKSFLTGSENVMSHRNNFVLQETSPRLWTLSSWKATSWRESIEDFRMIENRRFSRNVRVLSSIIYLQHTVSVIWNAPENKKIHRDRDKRGTNEKETYKYTCKSPEISKTRRLLDVLPSCMA